MGRTLSATDLARRARVRHSVRAPVIPAALLAQAVDTLGSDAGARSWFAAPAIGLGQQSPVDLLGTAAGRAAVANLLERMKHGVYV